MSVPLDTYLSLKDLLARSRIKDHSYATQSFVMSTGFNQRAVASMRWSQENRQVSSCTYADTDKLFLADRVNRMREPMTVLLERLFNN